ncbi:MAG: sec-independent protein translocase protein TatB [Oleiphilaceae bacterium]|jgi:sec-independent protein translocase protein TatB
MFDIGFLELVLVGIIGLIILGPERLPVAARTLGKWVGRARRLVSQFSQEIDKEIEIEELKTQLKKQGESLDINKDVRQIHETVSQALREAEQDLDKGGDKELELHSAEYEPLPRKEPNTDFRDQPSIEANQPSSTQPPSSAASTTPK